MYTTELLASHDDGKLWQLMKEDSFFHVQVQLTSM